MQTLMIITMSMHLASFCFWIWYTHKSNRIFKRQSAVVMERYRKEIENAQAVARENYKQWLETVVEGQGWDDEDETYV